MNGLHLLSNSVDQLEDSQENITHCLMFSLADEEYAVDMLCVQEVKVLDTVTTLPNTPDYIRGVFNFHGDIVPIIDLHLLLDAAEQKQASRSVALVLRLDSASRLVAVMVDDVLEPLDIADEDIKDVPDFGSKIDTSCIHGLVSINGKVKVILNVEQLLSREALD